MTQARALCAALLLCPMAAGADGHYGAGPMQGMLSGASFGFVAAETDLRYRRLFETGANVYSGRSSVEFAFAPEFAIQGDFLKGRVNDGVAPDQRGLVDGRLTDAVLGLFGDFQSVMLHGIFDYTEAAAFGVYLGRDYALGDDATTFGVETSVEFQGSEIQGWVGRSVIDGGPNDVTTFGIAARSDMAMGLGLDASIIHDEISDRDASFTNVQFGASYDVLNYSEVYATAGYAMTDGPLGSSGEATLGLGLRIGIGGDDGRTTFGGRSYFESLR